MRMWCFEGLPKPQRWSPAFQDHHLQGRHGRAAEAGVHPKRGVLDQGVLEADVQQSFRHSAYHFDCCEQAHQPEDLHQGPAWQPGVEPSSWQHHRLQPG